jgi:DNA end-binding protein Ku
MAPRANWKFYLKIAELTCPVALYTAASSAERVSFHMLDRLSGHRLRRVFVDSETGDPVELEDQVKGYEIGKDEYVVLEPEEISAAIPESDKILSVEVFIASTDFDDVYLDRPYYLGPADAASAEVFALIRDGLRQQKVVALARTVLFRRLRTLLLRPFDEGLLAQTLNYDYEVRSAQEAFAEIPDFTSKGEMLDLAKHIIAMKRGSFDPKAFTDRYEAALAELVRAKLEGTPLRKAKPAGAAKIIDLMQALRESAAAARKAEDGERASRRGGRKSARGSGKAPAWQSARRKAG